MVYYGVNNLHLAQQQQQQQQQQSAYNGTMSSGYNTSTPPHSLDSSAGNFLASSLDSIVDSQV